jgi:Tfp pilus assembly PilM family ATPase
MRLGIDIQKTQIFAALIRRRGSTWELLEVFHFVGDEGLEHLRQALPFFGVKCILALSRADIFLKEIAVDPELDANDIEIYLRKNISKMIPELKDELYWDYEYLSSKRQYIRVAAVRSFQVDALVKPLQKKGFHIMAVDVDELAKVRGMAEIAALSDPQFCLALGLALWEPA